MNVSDIFTEARKLAFVNATQFTDPQMTIWMNFLYQELCWEIKKLNENYFYVRGYIDTVAFQNTYSYALATSTVVTVQKILSLSVKYQADAYPIWVTNTQYLKGDKVVNSLTSKTYVANQDMTSWATFAGDIAKWVQIFEWYNTAREINYSTGDVDNYNTDVMNAFIDRFGRAVDYGNPTYILHSTSNQMDLSIYPYVDSVIVQGIKYDGIATIKDLASTTVEADILIERNYHKCLVLGLIPYIYQSRWLNNERIDAQNNYEMYKTKMLSEITDRTFSATNVELPNLSILE